MLKNKDLPYITGGFLNVTQRCNLKCKYCFVVQNPIDMEYEVARDVVDFYAEQARLDNSKPHINFFGGEPLLRWKEIVKPITIYIREKYGDNYSIGITTNGVLLDKEKLEFFKKHKVGILLSIDGDKKTQDINRPFHDGTGSFDLIDSKIDMLLKYVPNATFRATIDHDTAKYASDNYKYAIRKGYTNVFMIPNIFTEWTKEEMKTLENEIEIIGDIYIENYEKGHVVHFNQFSDMFGKIARISNLPEGYYRDLPNVPGYGRCGIGATKGGSAGATGNIYSCQEMVENPEYGDFFKIGDIYNGIDNNKRYEIIKKFDPKKIRRDDGKSCNTCPLDNICDGACLVNNYFKNKDLNIMSSVLCDFYIMLFNTSLRILNELSDRRNETFKKDFNRIIRGR